MVAKLNDHEIAIIKALLLLKIPNQEILGYINNARGDVKNHINNGRIAEIKQNKKGIDIKPVSEQEAKGFMEKYKNISNNKKLDFLHIKDGYVEIEESEKIRI